MVVHSSGLLISRWKFTFLGSRAVKGLLLTYTTGSCLRLTQKMCFSSPYFLRTGSRHFSKPSTEVWPAPKRGKPGSLRKLGAPSVLGAPSASLSIPSKASVIAFRSATAGVGGTIGPGSSLCKLVDPFKGIGHRLQVCHGGSHLRFSCRSESSNKSLVVR